MFFLKVHNDVIDFILLSRLHVRVHEDDIGGTNGVIHVVLIANVIPSTAVLL